MPTHMCLDCDSPGDGNCAVCHGIGKLPGANMAGTFERGNEVACAFCSGTGDCQKCDGSGEIDIGGEA